MNTDVKGWRRWVLRRLLRVDGVHVVIVADGVVGVETLSNPTIIVGQGPTRISGTWRGHIPYAPRTLVRTGYDLADGSTEWLH